MAMVLLDQGCVADCIMLTSRGTMAYDCAAHNGKGAIMSGENGDAIKSEVKTYVIRAGRCTQSERRNYQELKSKWCLPLTGESLQFDALFGNAHDTVIEIGFGMGDATAEIAQLNPTVNYIAIDVHVPGIGKLLGEIRRRGLVNIFVIEGDALSVLYRMISASSVAGFHVFFPDPWPKKRHHKRRLMRRPNTDLLASRLREGGYVYFATDWQDYAECALEELSATEGLVNSCDGFCQRQSWRPITKFEQKGIDAGRQIYELYFIKRTTCGEQ